MDQGVEIIPTPFVAAGIPLAIIAFAGVVVPVSAIAVRCQHTRAVTVNDIVVDVVPSEIVTEITV